VSGQLRFLFVRPERNVVFQALNPVFRRRRAAFLLAVTCIVATPAAPAAQPGPADQWPSVQPDVPPPRQPHVPPPGQPTVRATVRPAIGRLRLIGEQRIGLKQAFQGTVIGGLSGIDYDPASGKWIFVSDDRSQRNPARYYTASLAYDAHAFARVDIDSVHFLKQADGSNYPSLFEYLGRGGEIADFESIRFDPRDASIWYSSEGSRPLGLNPFVKHALADGTQPSVLPMPALFNTALGASGPRDNLAFEGLAFAPDGNTLWVAMEGPLSQDGPLPTPHSGAMARITHFGRDGAVLGQYAYPIDAIPGEPGTGRHAENGISEILAASDDCLLVLERAAIQDSAGRYRNNIRLYEMRIAGASDIQGLAAVPLGSFTPASKHLLADLDTFGLTRLDNMEGMAWGPKLPNGHRTLVMVSDDNFSAFEVVPGSDPVSGF
jgi:hypothetical protein